MINKMIWRFYAQKIHFRRLTLLTDSLPLLSKEMLRKTMEFEEVSHMKKIKY